MPSVNNIPNYIMTNVAHRLNAPNLAALAGTSTRMRRIANSVTAPWMTAANVNTNTNARLVSRYATGLYKLHMFLSSLRRRDVNGTLEETIDHLTELSVNAGMPHVTFSIRHDEYIYASLDIHPDYHYGIVFEPDTPSATLKIKCVDFRGRAVRLSRIVLYQYGMSLKDILDFWIKRTPNHILSSFRFMLAHYAITRASERAIVQDLMFYRKVVTAACNIPQMRTRGRTVHLQNVRPIAYISEPGYQNNSNSNSTASDHNVPLFILNTRVTERVFMQKLKNIARLAQVELRG